MCFRKICFVLTYSRTYVRIRLHLTLVKIKVLEDFSSVSPLPLESFFGIISPMLQPRFYSISSSPLLYPNHIHVTAAVVRERTLTGRIHKGVCTTHLSLTKPGISKLPIFVRRSTFKLPKRTLATKSDGFNVYNEKNNITSPPIIMIGPGTGLAPFRGFMQERSVAMRTSKNHDRNILGSAELYFGCRSKSTDFIYESEIEQFLTDGVIDDLHVAFSRDQEKKIYVQNRILDNKDSTWKRIVEGGFVYICGDARHMAKDVNRTLHRIAMDCGRMSGTEAEQFFATLHAQGRYMQDVW